MTSKQAARDQPPAAPTIETAPTTAAHPCDVCPTRSTAKDPTFDYCEGCPSVERHCRSCEQYKPQSGWWWGFGSPWGCLIGWVCPDCRFPPLDEIAAARNPELAASHPAVAEIAAAHPRFTIELDQLDDPDRRAEAAAALQRAAATWPGDPEAARVLTTVAAALRPAEFTNPLDIDVADVNLAARQQATQALRRAVYSRDTPQGVSAPLAWLMRTWEQWVEEQVPKPPRQPTEAERAQRRLAVLRAGRERRVDGGAQ